jgi:hypothetical protein
MMIRALNHDFTAADEVPRMAIARPTTPTPPRPLGKESKKQNARGSCMDRS